MGWLQEELDGVPRRDRAQEPSPAAQRHEPRQWERLWVGRKEGRKEVHSPLRPLALPNAAQQSGRKQPDGIQRLPEAGLSPEL